MTLRQTTNAIFIAIICINYSESFAESSHSGSPTSDKQSAHDRAVQKGLTPPQADVKALLKADPDSVLRVRQGEYQREVAFDEDLPHQEFVGETELSGFSLNEKTPPEVFIQRENPTSLEFVDITGSPWPINYARSHSDAIVLHEVTNESRNSVVLTSKAHAGSRHITVYLDGRSEAFILKVVSGSDRYHARRIFKIDRVASGTTIQFANMDSSRTVGMGADEDLLSAINGVKPAGFDRIKTSHPEVSAWSDQNVLILSSRLHLFSHVSLSSEAGDFGVKAVKLNPTTRATFLTDTGEVIDVKIGVL